MIRLGPTLEEMGAMSIDDIFFIMFETAYFYGQGLFKKFNKSLKYSLERR